MIPIPSFPPEQSIFDVLSPMIAVTVGIAGPSLAWLAERGEYEVKSEDDLAFMLLWWPIV